MIALGVLLAGLLLFATSKKSGGIPTAPAIPPDEVATAYRTALLTEKDPAQLRAFADSLQPDFASYAASLERKAAGLSP